MFFDDWSGLARILFVGGLAYIILILSLRASGKRTLSKWNAFDFVVTIALGSILATVMISKDVPLVEGIGALGLLVGLQFIITWLSARSPTMRNVIKAKPALLFEDGEFLDAAMRHERVSESEIRMAIRSAGVGDIDEVGAVILETDGSFSVVKRSKAGSRSALSDVFRPRSNN